MKTSKDTARQFLKNNGLLAERIDPDSVLDDFLKEMESGLAGKESSLAMIPTFISIENSVPAFKPVIALDAGGTNLRVAEVVFDGDGNPRISRLTKHKMPGSGGELNKNDFFDKFVEFLLPFAGRADSVGFCFSYPAEIYPDRDGRLIAWTKEIQAPEIVGKFIGKNVFERLARKGHRLKFTILNDTVATLLAGKSVDFEHNYDTYIGFILGTGTNTAYIERNSRITKRNDLDLSDSQAINTESGNFSKCPRGPVDIEFDKTTEDPGQYPFEKMISGAYLGGLCLTALSKAAGEGLLSWEGTRWISSREALSTIDVDSILRGPEKGIAGGLRDLSTDDREVIRYLCSAVCERAALLAAINVGAAILKSSGGLSSRPVCVNIDGSVYYKIKGFSRMVEGYLEKILRPKHISYELIRVDDSPLIGAAVAGLLC
ncbi:MAG: hexokinase [Candidatus Aminicenantes bacterium]|jgi:hexokinase